MKVPAEIREVERPPKTVVAAQVNKKSTRYYVREIEGTVRKNGRTWNRYGAVIGEIVDGKFVPKPPASTDPDEIDMETWVFEEIVKSVTQDVLDDLRIVFPEKTAETLYTMAVLRVRRPSLKDSRMKADYESSILREMYPGLPLSKNSVSALLRDLGLHNLKIRQFLKIRLSRLPKGTKLAVDGVLVGDDSIVNNLSAVSRKAKVRGGKEVSMLYAYSIDDLVPVCFTAYPGNLMDTKAYADFIEVNDLKDAILVGDKAFTPEAARKEFSDPDRDLHYLFPIRKNAAAITKLHLHDYNSVLETYPGISYIKVHDTDRDIWYYSFRDAGMAASEEESYLDRKRKSGRNIDSAELTKEKQRFGTIIYRSDVDIEAEKAYAIYKQRWLIEEMFRLYKEVEEFDETRVQTDASVFGTAFVNFLSTLMTSKLMNRLMESGVLEDRTFGEVTEILRKTLRFRKEDGSWMYRALSDKEKSVLRTLGLFEQLPPKRGRGRPRKNPQ